MNHDVIELWDKYLQDTDRRVSNKAQTQLLLMLGESGGSMSVLVCNIRSCAWVLSALFACLILQQLTMLHWLVPGLRSPSLVSANKRQREELGWTGKCIFIMCTTWLGGLPAMACQSAWAAQG